ncbi:hypothetical protein [Gordonia sp. UBA7599]|nr:hypothetical protein [Gordonia sp. UBA7599]HNP58422.1 hypothetical protein [Gordonia sp. (in: high G+C Gram-positive bacteria)]
MVIKDIVANRWLIVKVDSGTYSAKAETNSQSDANALVAELNA